MKQLVLLGALVGLASCQSNIDVVPVSPISELAGTYQTNGFINYRCLALPANKMPTVTLRAADNHSFTLTLTKASPKNSVQTFTGVTFIRQPDQSIKLIQAGRLIGSVQTSRVFTASGMETEGKLLRLSAEIADFTGYRP